jgi:hypothetical protein
MRSAGSSGRAHRLLALEVSVIATVDYGPAGR